MRNLITAPSPRIVLSYDGAQVEDACDTIRVRFIEPPKKGVLSALRKAGFKLAGQSIVLECKSDTATIISAQTIMGEHYGEAKS